jgi:hypothetical protein
MVRTALASLVDTRPEWRNTPVFDVGSAAWSLGRVRDHRDFGIVPRGGITSAEKTVLALSLDEVRAIERDDACHLPLRFDDPPTVWTEPELTDWLVRTPIHFGSTRGWVGLRFPFDGTGAIMSRIEGRLIPEGPASRRLPSHGIIWSARPQVGDQPTPPHIIQLAQRQLYTLLAEGLGQGRWSGERAETADCYARIWVLHEVGTDRRPSTTLGTALAESASVPGTDGSRWGSLATWLKTPASERPAMDHQPIERTAAPSSLPSMDQPLAAWLTQLAQWVTGEPLLEVALRPNPLFDEVSDPVLQAGPSGTDWRTCWVTISDDLRMSVNDPRIGLETRWMIALFMLRRWLPNLRKNWVDVDLATCRQDMLSRLLVSQST